MNFKATHRHYKGNLYQKIGVALHTETSASLVIYQDAGGRLFARPEDMFNDVLIDGQRRFFPLEKTP